MKMNFPYTKLFSPFTLQNGLVLKSRITSPNALHGLNQGPETWPAEPQIFEATEFASSGASLFSYRHYGKFGGGAFGNRALGDHVDKAHIPLLDYTDPSTQNYLCQIASQAHMYGAKILIKLEQAFPDGYSYGGGNAGELFPYPSPFPPRKVGPACPKELFPEIIVDMVALLKKYKSWGYDGMNFRCDRYIDAATNLRTDEYGGEIENRGRFTYELFSAIKKELGSDFIIEGAYPGCQTYGADGELPHGYTLDEAIRFAKLIEDCVDILQIRAESGAAYHPTGYNSKPHVHPNLLLCRAFKEAGVKVPLAANAGFFNPDDMEAAVESGDCDLISAGRLFIAEPEFAKKVFSFPVESPTPCVMCNKCHGTDSPPWLAFCTVNPKSGIGHRLPAIVKPPIKLKKVAVIGGGAIGMRTACYAAEKGHRVTLFEKTGYLGGKLKFADVYDFKWPFRRYRLWLIDELARRGVEVKVNCEPSPDMLRAEGFDAIIACTGSTAKRPDISGADLPGVWTSEDVYEGRAALGRRVVVVGGSEVGTETGMHLAMNGREVTVITRQKMLMPNEMRPHGPHGQFVKIDPELGYGTTVPAWGVLENLTEITEANTTAVTATSVTYIKDGKEYTIDCDSVIVNGGYAECRDDAFRYVGCAPEFYLAGDVEDNCGNIQQGNLSAFGKASLL